MNSLQEQVLNEERESFKIDSLQGATWAFRKLRAINDKESEVKAIAEGEMSRIQMWLESELRIVFLLSAKADFTILKKTFSSVTL